MQHWRDPSASTKWRQGEGLARVVVPLRTLRILYNLLSEELISAGSGTARVVSLVKPGIPDM